MFSLLLYFLLLKSALRLNRPLLCSVIPGGPSNLTTLEQTHLSFSGLKIMTFYTLNLGCCFLTSYS